MIFILIGYAGLTFFSFILFALFVAAFLGGYIISRPGNTKRFPLIWKMGMPLILVGSAALFINIYLVGAIPLLVPALRSHLLPSLSYISFLIVPGVLIRVSDHMFNKKEKEALIWVAVGTFLISLLGYRTEIYAILLGSFFCAYYIKGGSVKRKQVVKNGMIFSVILLAINFSVIAFRPMPTSEFANRFAFTTHVFSSIADSMGPSLLGHSGGLIHTSILSSLKIIPGPRIGPRTFISQMIGVGGGSTTPTIIGLPYVDFGILGVIFFGLILGLLYGTGYKTLRKGNIDILPVHALCLAFLLITIETGIADTIVILYLLAYLVMVI